MIWLRQKRSQPPFLLMPEVLSLISRTQMREGETQSQQVVLCSTYVRVLTNMLLTHKPQNTLKIKIKCKNVSRKIAFREMPD